MQTDRRRACINPSIHPSIHPSINRTFQKESSAVGVVNQTIRNGHHHEAVVRASFLRCTYLALALPLQNALVVHLLVGHRDGRRHELREEVGAEHEQRDEDEGGGKVAVGVPELVQDVDPPLACDHDEDRQQRGVHCVEVQSPALRIELVQLFIHSLIG